jgi:hypothetical protein
MMTYRTTFAPDVASAQRLKRLATRLRISQAEVVRRSLEQTEKSIEIEKPDPISMLQRLHESGGGIAPARAETWMAEIRENRKHSRSE